MINYSTITKNYIYLIFTKFLVSFTNLVTFAYLARVLDISDYGTLNYSFSIIMLFTILVHMGIPKLGTREIARYKDFHFSYKRLMNGILQTRLMLAALAFILLSLLVLLLPSTYRSNVIIIMYGFQLFPFALMINWFFEGTQDMKHIAHAQGAASIIYISSVLIFIRSSNDIFIVPLLRTAYVFCIAAVSFLILYRSFDGLKLQFNFRAKESLKLIGKAAPMTAVKFKNTAIFYINVIMLGLMAGEAFVGIYSAALEILFFIMILPAIYSEVIFPVCSRYYHTDREKIEHIFVFSVRILILTIFPIAVFCATRSDALITAVFGKEYADSIEVFKLLSLVSIPVAFNMFFGTLLISCEKQFKYLTGTVSALVTAILCNILFVGRFYSMGAALSMLIAETLLFIYFLIEIRKLLTVKFLEGLLKPASAVFAISLYIFITRDISFFFSGISSLLIYGSMLFSFDIIKTAEI